MRLHAAAALALIAIACDSKENAKPPPPPPPTTPAPPPKPAGTEISDFQLLMFQPLKPEPAPTEPAKVAQLELGKALFDSPKLSKGGDVSCATCHDLARAGTDGKKTPAAPKGGVASKRNVLPLFDVAGHAFYGWDARGATLASFLEEHLADKSALNADAKSLQAALGAAPLKDAWTKAYPDGKARKLPPTTGVADALAAHLSQLTAPARWDRFLGGDKSALSEAEKKGFVAFANAGCAACHAGPHLGAQQVQKFGLVSPWPGHADEGRAAITKAPDDKFMFKVPTLRNVASTGPYFHDGSVDSLEEAIRLMAFHQFARKLSPDEAKSIATFLGSTSEAPPGTRPPPPPQ